MNQKFVLTKDIPYLALTGEPWGVFRENIWESRPRYNGTAVYIYFIASQASVSELILYPVSYTLYEIYATRIEHFRSGFNLT